MTGRRALALVLTAGVVAAAWACRELAIDNRLERFLGDDAASRAAYERFRGLFGSDEFVLVAITGDDVFDADVLELQLAAVEAVESLDDVVRVQAPAQVWRDRLGAEDTEALVELVTGSPFYRRLLVSDDGRTVGLLATVDPAEEAGARRRLVAGLEAAMAPLEAAGLEIRMVGSTVLSSGLDEVSGREARRLFPLAVLGSLAVLALLLRSLRAMVVAAAAAAMAVVLTLGLVAACGRSLNMVTTALAPLVWVLAVGNVVHILRRYRVLAARGSALEALETALGQTRRACTLAALTTAAGFASLLFAPLTPVRELGGFAAAGLLLALAVNLTVAPELVALLRVPGDRRAGRLERRGWERAALTRPTRVVVAIGLMAAAALATLPWLRVESNPLSFLPRAHRVVDDYAATRDRIGGFYTLEVVVEPAGAWTDPAALAVLDRLGDRLAASAVVSRVVSPLDVLRELRRWSEGLEPEAYALPAERSEAEGLLAGLDDRGRAALAALVAVDGRTVRLSAVVDEMDQGLFLELVGDAHAAIGELPAGWQASVTGQVLELVTAQQRLVLTQLESLGVALVLVFLVLLAGLGSLRLTLLSAAPNLLPLLAAFATMAVLGLPLDPATAMVASIALGVAVDNTAHVLETTRALERAGHVRREAVALVLRRVGPAMVVGSATAAVGFAALAASDFVPISHFGVVSVAALAAALLGDLVLLPALLVWRRP